MLYRIAATEDVCLLKGIVSEIVITEITQDIAALVNAYGGGGIGGITLVAQTIEDVQNIKNYVNYKVHPCEWAERIEDYVSALYLMNNEYSIRLYIPQDIAPKEITNDL